MRSECGACGRFCKLLPGGFGHRPGRHYDRPARCLAELGSGEGVKPARAEAPKRKLPSAVRKRGPELSGGVRSPKREPRWSAERRARFRKARCRIRMMRPKNGCAYRRSASLRFREGCLKWWTKLGRKARRENEERCLRETRVSSAPATASVARSPDEPTGPARSGRPDDKLRDIRDRHSRSNPA
jgi:hypothetical protein